RRRGGPGARGEVARPARADGQLGGQVRHGRGPRPAGRRRPLRGPHLRPRHRRAAQVAGGAEGHRPRGPADDRAAAPQVVLPEIGAVAALEPVVRWRGRRVLMVSSVDRFGMAEALAQQGADVLYGDLIFGLGIDVPLRSLEALKGIARVARPMIARLPFRWFYPTGASQDAPPRPRHQRHYRWAEVLAGDWHYIRAH